MRLVAYLRVSSNGQLDGYGFAVQRKDITRWAKANGHKMVAEFTDAVTGKADTADRPGLLEALQLIRKPPDADGLVVGKLDRLARQLTVQEAVLALVWREGGRVFAAESGEILRDDPDDPMRTAIRQMSGVFAELDRRTIVKRLRDGRRAKAESGKHAVGQYKYGYTGAGKGRERDAAPCEDEQRVVRRIVELRAAGEPYRAIAATLDAEGLRPGVLCRGRRCRCGTSLSARAAPDLPGDGVPGVGCGRSGRRELSGGGAEEDAGHEHRGRWYCAGVA